MLEDIQARGLEQLVQLPHIGLSPGTLDTRRTAETGLLAGRQQHIILRINMTTGQQRITAKCNLLGTGIIGQLLHPRQVLRRIILRLETAPEGHDDHLETYFGTLVNRFLHRLRIGTSHMHQDRILRHPRSHRTHHPAVGQRLALPIPTVVQQFPHPETGEGLSNRHRLGRTYLGSSLQQAGGSPIKIHLSLVERIPLPG